MSEMGIIMWLLGVLAAVLGTLWGVVVWVWKTRTNEHQRMLESHGKRIGNLERESVNREHFDQRLDTVRSEMREQHRELIEEVRGVHKRIDAHFLKR